MEEKNVKSDMISLDLKILSLEFRDKSITLAIPVLVLCSFYLMSLIMALNSLYPLTAGLFLLGICALASWLRTRGWVQSAAWLIVGGVFVLSYLLYLWSGHGIVLILLILPIGLGMILIGKGGGVGFACLSSTLVLLIPSENLYSDQFFKGLLIFIFWSMAGMIILSQTPLKDTIEIAWADYLQSRNLLEQNREYQMQLSQALDDLKHISAQLVRMNELANSLRMIAQQERDAKEQFVANVSHELRTPLNMIVGFAEMILQAPKIYARNLPEKLMADLMIILRNAQHLSSLVDDVLDLSQIDAGQMSLLRERVNLSEIIEAAVTAIRPLFLKKGLYLRTEIAPDIPMIYCDRTRIRQVVLNLLSNAGRFTEKGGVSIKTWTENRNVVVSVADTGIGISNEEKAKLFQPFHQMDVAIRRQYGGTGLGLSISKSFIELHHGKMWVESNPDQGSIFYFQLPIDSPTEISSALRWINPYVPHERLKHLTNLSLPQFRQRWLVVESGKALQKLMKRYIENVDILSAGDLQVAEKIMSMETVNAILVNATDSNINLTNLLKEVSLPGYLPVLLCDMPEAAYVGETQDVIDYLIKPIDQQRLYNILESLPEDIKTILIVDDEPDVHQLFGRLLDSWKHPFRILRAYNGSEAMEILEEEAKNEGVDLILIDLVMPEMDGFDLLRRKQQHPTIKNIPVILISARDPQGHPISSRSLTVSRTGGLSIRQLLACIEAFSAILTPTSSTDGLKLPEMHFDPPA